MSKTGIITIIVIVIILILGGIFFSTRYGKSYQYAVPEGVMINQGTPDFNIDNSKFSDSNILIVYFTRSNNTKTIAEYIHEHVGGDMFEVQTAIPYPVSYAMAADTAKGWQNNNERPELKSIKNIDQYDTIFIGTPIRWGTYPMPMFTYLESQNWEGKTVIPFTTHEGSGLGNVPQDLQKATNAEKYLQALAINGKEVGNAKDEVLSWLDGLNF